MRVRVGCRRDRGRARAQVRTRARPIPHPRPPTPPRSGPGGGRVSSARHGHPSGAPVVVRGCSAASGKAAAHPTRPSSSRPARLRRSAGVSLLPYDLREPGRVLALVAGAVLARPRARCSVWVRRCPGCRCCSPRSATRAPCTASAGAATAGPGRARSPPLGLGVLAVAVLLPAAVVTVGLHVHVVQHLLSCSPARCCSRSARRSRLTLRSLRTPSRRRLLALLHSPPEGAELARSARRVASS